MPEQELPSKNISEPKQTEHTAPESADEFHHTDNAVPIASAPIQPHSKESPYHCEITCKIEKHWWDKAKPFVEMVGIILLAIYTGYTVKMYCANRKAAEAAARAAKTAACALEENKRQFSQTLAEVQKQTKAQQDAATASQSASAAAVKSVKDFETVQAGRLSIENFSVERTAVPATDKRKAYTTFRVTWDVYNRGNSILYKITWSRDGASHITDTQAWTNAEQMIVRSNVEGQNLAPNTQPIVVELTPPSTRELTEEGMHPYFEWMKVVGVDIFGHDQNAIACIRSHKASNYIPCLVPPSQPPHKH